MNTFKRLTAALALYTAFFAHNVQAASRDSFCVSLGGLGGAILTSKKLGVTEDEMITHQTKNFKDKALRTVVINMIKYIYLDDGAYVDGKWLYTKCLAKDFD